MKPPTALNIYSFPCSYNVLNDLNKPTENRITFLFVTLKETHHKIIQL